MFDFHVDLPASRNKQDCQTGKCHHIMLIESDMNIQQPTHIDKTAFLAWAQGREERFELSDHRIVPMAGCSKLHAVIASRLIRTMWARLDTHKWVVLGSNLAVDSGPANLRYPDVLVDPIGNNSALTATAPALIAEVLSPASALRDLVEKTAEYLRLPSLMAYLVFSQDRPNVLVWVRGPDGFPATAVMFNGLDKIIGIASLGINLPLSQIYEGFDRT
jgi:Uma2 family endonuclease